MDEFEIIRRLFTPETYDSSVRVGVGDDGAVLRPVAGRDLVTVVDTMVSGVHFPQDLEPGDVGYRAVAVNASDIAAMGGRPRWMTLALTLSHAEPGWLQHFSAGILSAAREFGVDLVGGDITRGSQIVMSVQITGDIQPNLVMKRGGAKPGDGIYVSGSPGDAALGLSFLSSLGAGESQSTEVNYLIRRFSRPNARVALGQAIAPVATAAIDISDGLYGDLEKLLAASGVAGTIELNALPFSEALTTLVTPQEAIRLALGGGDDYELCFTAGDPAVERIGQQVGVPVTRIGYVSEGRGLACVQEGKPYDYRDQGYRHFQ